MDVRMRKLGLQGITITDQARSRTAESVKQSLNAMGVQDVRECLAKIRAIEEQAKDMEPALSVIVNLGVLSFQGILAEWLATSGQEDDGA